MKTTTVTCDICKTVLRHDNHAIDIPVVFNTEQTEGYPCKPYLTHERLDLCDACYSAYLDAFPLKASGAQGVNQFYPVWKNKKGA